VKDSMKKYAWIELKKAGDVAKGFTSAHTGQSYPFDYIRKGDKKTPMSKAVKFASSLNNPAIAQGILFKLNILASDSGITPRGLGDLEVDTLMVLAGRNLQGQTLAEVSNYLDTIMTYWKVNGIDSADGYAELDNVAKHLLKSVNDGFYAAMTTGNYTVDSVKVVAKNAYAVTLSGTKTAEELGIVKRNPDARQTHLVFSPQTERPNAFALYQNYPNPFNPMTTIRFTIPESRLTTMKIYNILGQEVATLLNNEAMDEGTHEVQFDASRLSSGVYFYRINVNNGEFVQVKKLLLMK